MSTTAATGLRSWAKGMYATEAGVELLIRSFAGQFAQVGCPWIKPCHRPGVFWLDVATLLDYRGVCSGGERRVLTVVAALVDGRPVDDLADVLAGLDRQHLTLVLAASAHAAGSHDQVDVIRHGDQLALVDQPALIPWPENRRAA